MTSEKPDQNIRIPILTKLFRNDFWGASYTTVKNCLSKIPKHDHGKAKKEMDDMNKDGLIQFHKRKKCVSLNPSAKDEIEEKLRDHLPDFYF